MYIAPGHCGKRDAGDSTAACGANMRQGGRAQFLLTIIITFIKKSAL